MDGWLRMRTDDHKFLVELACATTLTAGYNLELFEKVIPRGKGSVLFIVCGGFKVSMDEMVEYGRLAETAGDEWEILCDGEKVRVGK